MNKVLNIQFMQVTGETDIEKVSLFLSLAESKILEATNRTIFPEELWGTKLNLAVALYNKNGEEGTSSYNEGGVSRTFMSEQEILSTLKNKVLTPAARRIKDENKGS